MAAAVSACLVGSRLGAAAARRRRLAAAGPARERQPGPGSGATLQYRGTFTGAPLGSGKVNLRTRLGGGGDATVSYTMSNSRGSISGSAKVTLIYSGSTVSYKGLASITKGTGSYRRVRSRSLRIAGRAGLTAENVTLSLIGPITS